MAKENLIEQLHFKIKESTRQMKERIKEENELRIQLEETNSQYQDQLQTLVRRTKDLETRLEEHKSV